MDKDKDMVYYIFSRKSLCEMICTCKWNEYIENPKLQTGIYRMGTMLSKTITLSDAWIEKDFSISWKEDVIRDKIKAGRFMPATLSFFSAVCGDPAVDKILEVLLLGHETIHIKWKNDILMKYFKCYMQYFTLCIEQKEFCSVERLKRFIKETGDTMPIDDIYIGSQNKNHDEWSRSEIIDLFSEPSEKDQYYIPPQIKHSNPFSVKVDFPESKKTGYGKLELPLNVFKIYDAVDLISASLYCIFSQKNVIRKCRYCGGLFVTTYGNQKYCPTPKDKTKDKTEIKNCYQQANLERQSRKKIIGIDKMEKKLRDRLYSRHNYYRYACPKEKEREKTQRDREDTYETFIDANKKLKKMVSKGEITEEDFRKWFENIEDRFEELKKGKITEEDFRKWLRDINERLKELKKESKQKKTFLCSLKI